MSMTRIKNAHRTRTLALSSASVLSVCLSVVSRSVNTVADTLLMLCCCSRTGRICAEFVHVEAWLTLGIPCFVRRFVLWLLLGIGQFLHEPAMLPTCCRILGSPSPTSMCLDNIAGGHGLVCIFLFTRLLLCYGQVGFGRRTVLLLLVSGGGW